MPDFTRLVNEVTETDLCVASRPNPVQVFRREDIDPVVEGGNEDFEWLPLPTILYRVSSDITF
jgi:hypothetical protein